MPKTTIWKYPIPVQEELELKMPFEAELLYVATQDPNSLEGCLWARVNPDNGLEQRRFFVRGTGHPVDPAFPYVGSFILRGGQLVFHLFADRR